MSNHIPRKRFGQHFLRDQNIIQQIVASLGLKKTDHVVEIGPGMGALTTVLLPNLQCLDVVEFDRDLIPKLALAMKPYGELKIHQADALTFDFLQLANAPQSLRIVGNLPYNISTPLLFHLMSFISIIRDMTFMLQLEVAERICAAVGDSNYGRLSVMVQYFCKPQMLFLVPPEAFFPPPKVESAVIQLIPYEKLPFMAKDFNLFLEVVRLAFNQRRKVLSNSLRTHISAQQLKELNINPELRAEKLSVEDFVCIANYLA